MLLSCVCSVEELPSENGDLKYTSGEIVFFKNISSWLHLSHLGNLKTK